MRERIQLGPRAEHRDPCRVPASGERLDPVPQSGEGATQAPRQAPDDRCGDQEGDHEPGDEGDQQGVAMGPFDVHQLGAAERQVGLQQVTVEDRRRDQHGEHRDARPAHAEHQELTAHEPRRETRRGTSPAAEAHRSSPPSR